MICHIRNNIYNIYIYISIHIPMLHQPLFKRFQARNVFCCHQDFGLPAAALSRSQRPDGSPRGVEKDGVTRLLLLKNGIFMGFHGRFMGFKGRFMGFNGRFMGFNGIFMGFNGRFMGFNGIFMGFKRRLMGFNGIFMGFNGRFMGFSWDLMVYPLIN